MATTPIVYHKPAGIAGARPILADEGQKAAELAGADMIEADMEVVKERDHQDHLT
jgi:hypothetical protein